MIISYFRSKKIPLGLFLALLLLGLLYLVSFIIFIKTSPSDEDKYLYWEGETADTHYMEIETKDMGSISTVQDTLMAAGQDGNLYLWDWRELSKEPKIIELDPKSWIPKFRDREFLDNKIYALLSHKWIIHALHEEDDMMVLVVKEVEGQKEVKRWAVGKEWDCEQLRNTRNGRFIAVWLDANRNRRINGINCQGDQTGYRLGVIGPNPTDIQWLPTLFRRDWTLPHLYACAASEEGNYVCIVGNVGGGWIMLADVVRKKIVWEKNPKSEDILYGRWTVAFKDVCFSPDGKRIYVAGNCGLFCFETATGKVIKQWPMGLAVSVAVSPDERLVAVGMLDNDDVYICDVNSANPVGIPVLRLDTGQPGVSSLAFSPDSKFLATEGIMTKNIKIWKMPPPVLETKTAIQKE
ncbi:MAG: WD40 repeat domain-containing protein [Planctomycetota bacterium]|jgi:WD40 repeat protein